MTAKPINYKGFSLIELIAGIVVFSIVMVIVVTLVINQSRQSIDPIWQTRAAELAQSLAGEISSRAFDENATLSGGLSRCGESVACTAVSALGPDAQGVGVESRDNFDDIDDYNGLDEQGGNIANALGNAIDNQGQSLYAGFRAQVNVFYDDDFDGQSDASIGVVKHVRITITTPGGETLPFAFYRWNF